MRERERETGEGERETERERTNRKTDGHQPIVYTKSFFNQKNDIYVKAAHVFFRFLSLIFTSA